MGIRTRIIVLLMLSACVDKSIVDRDTQTVSSLDDWNICPKTTKDMTEFQKYSIMSHYKVEGKKLRFTGIVSEVRFEQMDGLPVIFLNSPSESTTLNIVFGFVPPTMTKVVLNINKKDKVVISGTGIGTCSSGSLGLVYLDLNIDAIELFNEVIK